MIKKNSKKRNKKSDDVKGINIRRCVGCRQRKYKSELIRIVKISKNNLEKNPFEKEDNVNKILIDIKRRYEGRGAYICKDINCLKISIKGNKIAKSLSTKIDKDIYDGLEKIILEDSQNST